MFKKTIILSCLGSLSMFLFCFNSSNSSDGDNDEAMIIRKVRNTLTQMHYSSIAIDDKFSKEVFKKYLENIDPYKRFFLQSDFEEFKKNEEKMDDDFNSENLDFHNLVVNRYYERIEKTEKIVDEILKNPIDLNVDEYLILDEKQRTFAKDENEHKKEWEKFIKYQMLNEIAILKEVKPRKDSLTKKPQKPKIALTFNQMKDSSLVEVKEYMSSYFRRSKARKKKDLLSVYINAFTESFDPHTTYFSPKENDNFTSSMSGKIIGVGAKLQDKKGYPTFSELIIGGPAWKSKEIEVGDKIIKVGQGNSEPVNVVGMLLEDAIQLIRGKEKSKVVLVLQKKDGSIKSVSMIREEIELEETFAKSAVIETENKEKYGIIYLPEFYVNMDDSSKGRSCSEDIRKEIIELKKENIKGLIIDLRGDGGGSLPEVVKIAGFFISKGPVVQIRRSDGYEQVHEDKDEQIEWDGPLTIMVNEMSASASEILAAAIQDYKRGIIVGSTQTYGKGTVQSVIPLDRFSFSSDKYGAIKLTIQKFYRINGSSTQRKGVIPDVILKSPYEYADIRESAQESALAWDEVKKLNYTEWNKKIDYDLIKSNSLKRTQNEPFLAKIDEKAKWIQSITKEKNVPLKYDSYILDSENKTKIAKKYDKELEYKTNFKLTSPKYEKEQIVKDTVLKNKRIKWHKELSKDYYLKETVNVLREIK